MNMSITIEELRNSAIEGRMTLESVLNEVEKCSSWGSLSFTDPNITKETISDLILFGFTVTTRKGVCGEEILHISWK